jgi:signal transduction histidine kinase
MWYNIHLVPYLNITISLYIGIVAYAIFRFRLMDIKVAITRAGIFAIVYTLVLGVPFWLGYKYHLWMHATWLMLVLATLGPFIYIYLDRKAEQRLLKEQRRYQETLRQASVGMTRIRNLKRLLDLITHIVTKTVKITYAGIYLYDREADEYILQVCRDKGRTPIPKLSVDNPLIQRLINNRQPLIYEEVRLEAQTVNHTTQKSLEENMRLLTASVVIPSFLEDRLLGFIVLGEKASGQIYTPDDLNVFQVLAAQSALAIENARFFEETKQMQEQIGQAEKMATIGTMADGLSHQINNRFYALSLIAADTIDTIKLTDTSQCSPEVKEMLGQINHALERIKDNVIQGGEVVKGVLKYTRKGEEGLEPLALDQILDATLDMLKYKINLSEIDITRGYVKDLPKIKGNQIQLQEVFFNFCDNAYDAIVERKVALKEEGYRGKINFSAQPKDTMLEITIEDNGMGIKEDLGKKVFTPFFTTKTSSHKGTGLGLYVIKKIITDNQKGRVSFKSAYKVGTRFIVELPLA